MIKIGGFQRFSLIDYPGELCAIVFTIGCNFRCPYCHNPELANGDAKPMETDEILDFLEKRKGKLTGVSITGGEPTIHKNDLVEFIKKLKVMGYKVKLDTNGSHPEVLQTLLNEKLLNYIAMDIKAPLEKYAQITGSNIEPETIRESIEIIMKSGIDYEFRTTVVENFVDIEDIQEILKLIKTAKLYCIQNFRPTKTLDKGFLSKSGLSSQKLEQAKQIAEKFVDECVIRG